MKRFIFTLVLVEFILMGCILPGRHGPVIIPPPLPPIVVLEGEPYYSHNGYQYYYHHERWYYSKSRGGPWEDLPRSHYPKEIRFKERDRDGRRGGDWHRDHERHEKNNQYYRYERP